MTRAFIAVLAGLMVSSFAFGVPEAKSWKIIRGDALRKLFANREFGDGVHFAYRFRAEGTFSGTEIPEARSSNVRDWPIAVMCFRPASSVFPPCSGKDKLTGRHRGVGEQE